MAQALTATVTFLVLLVHCSGLSLHTNCGGHNDSSVSVAQQKIIRKANAGSALSASMGSYPGTSSGVSGVVSVTVDGGLLKVAYTLTGLDASLTSGGLHIHSGSGTEVCSDSSLPGGHYFATGFADPWFTTWAKSSGDTTAVGSFTVGASGYDTLADNDLHAVVVHGAGGARVGCGFLQYYGSLSSSIGSYPGTSSGVSGVFTVSVYTGVLEVSYTLDGLAASETSGGLHIHSGAGADVCSSASLPGGHYFATGFADPWSTTWSKAAGSTVAKGSFTVGASGYDTIAANADHAVVLHAASGARIGCGYAGAGKSLTAAMGSYPGTASGVSGTVTVTVSMGLLSVSYTLTGLSSSDTSGGLHIHSGYGASVCSDPSLPGGHYFASGFTDPWYTTWTKAAGTTVASGSFTVLASGYDTLAENYLHAVVVHAGSGARIGCGVLGGSFSSPFATGDPHLQNLHGERFDLMKPGKHLLIQVPRKSPENTLLRVDADAQREGGQCTDMYFQELNITGAWAEARQTGGFHYHADDVDGKPPQWAHFGSVQLKVSHGRTRQGVRYLNLYVKDLMRTGYAVGGLLGDDDHAEASAPPAECARRMALLRVGSSGAL
ncbi:unnamed protein product [Prorocentrum cordatum]|uniref:CHRD domain-containing protein n=1 Tax=Prorocentrum cordatum TaxID=2364126 RepID=A0ABN9XI84_9DINO|nr:unnamed protein product [Polarella glacialis]